MLFICQCRRHVFSRRYFRYSIYTVTARVVQIGFRLEIELEIRSERD